MNTSINLFKQSVGPDCLHIIAAQKILDKKDNINYIQPDYDFSGMYKSNLKMQINKVCVYHI